VPPLFSCLNKGHPSPEVTGVICLVPSASFSQAPWYTLPSHLCRFTVRSIMKGLFPGRIQLHIKSNNNVQRFIFVTTFRSRNINLVPIDYAVWPRLRGRLTLRRLALRRKPWDFGENVSHIFCRYSCQHSHFQYLQHTSQYIFTGLWNAPLPL
jgi:hypothetical protein